MTNSFSLFIVAITEQFPFVRICHWAISQRTVSAGSSLCEGMAELTGFLINTVLSADTQKQKCSTVVSIDTWEQEYFTVLSTDTQEQKVLLRALPLTRLRVGGTGSTFVFPLVSFNRAVMRAFWCNYFSIHVFPLQFALCILRIFMECCLKSCERKTSVCYVCLTMSSLCRFSFDSSSGKVLLSILSRATPPGLP